MERKERTCRGGCAAGVTYRHRTHGIFKEVNELGAEIDMDPLPEEEREIVFSRRNLTVISSYDITFNNKLLGLLRAQCL